MNRLIVDMSIFSKEITYNEINNYLSMQYDSYCNKWWKMNDRKIGATNDEYIWLKKSWINESEEDLNIHLEKLYYQFASFETKLSELEKKWCTFQISINYYCSWHTLGMNIESDILKKINNLWIKISIDINMYLE